MKKFLVILLTLALLTPSVLAEGISPQMFVASRGLMVLDQNQMASMGGESNDVDLPEGVSLVAFSAGTGENSAPSIFWVLDGVMYAAFDMTAMFGQGTLDAKGMSQVFIDLCQNYDFDLATAGHGGEQTDVTYIRDMSVVDAFGVSAQEVRDGIINVEALYTDRDEFVAAVRTLFE